MQYRPEVVVLDIQMPEGSGVEATVGCASRALTVGILILTTFDDPPSIKAAIEAGANGYVMNSANADTIVEAV